MKKITIIALGMILSSTAFAQESAISKFFSKYVEDREFTHVVMTSRMFGLFANLDAEAEEDKEIIETISKITGLQILGLSDSSRSQALYKEAFELIPRSNYDELLGFRDSDNEFKFLINEKDGIITELLMVMGGTKEFFVLSLVGDIDLKQISKLSKIMDIDGFEHLENIDKN